jgi:cytochrome c oxidase subunit III
MPRLMPSSTRPSRYNGDSIPPHTGGGDDGRGRGSGDNMPDSTPNYGERLRRARRALAVAMTPVFMLFISFTAVYVIRRELLSVNSSHIAGYVQTWIPVRLPWTLLLINTAILIVSSVTIELGRREITREAALAPVRSIPGISLGDETHFPWLPLTTVLGFAFLAGQLFLWNQLSVEGFHLTGGTSVSFIYILTAMHGLHLAGGIIALLYANITAILHRPVEARRVVVDITSWYWHCMTALWIYILVLFWFAAP